MGSAIVIDFAAAKRRILAKRAAARPACNPFAEGHLLRALAAKRDPETLAIYGRTLVERDVRHLSNSQLVAAIKRDMVRARAKAAL